MYSLRPHSSENIEFDLPTTMYSVQPVIQQNKRVLFKEQQSVNESGLKEIEQRQDTLLEKIENLYNQLVLYQKKGAYEKAMPPVREELVVHLSAAQPSKNILNLIEQFREKLSLRTFRHSSLRNNAFQNPIQNSVSSNNRKLTVIWADEGELPFMFHAHMKINDEQLIVNLLSQQITNND